MKIDFFSFEEAVINFNFIKKFHFNVQEINRIILCKNNFSAKRLFKFILIFGLKDFFITVLKNFFWKINGGRIKKFAKTNNIDYLETESLDNIVVFEDTVGFSYNFEKKFTPNIINKYKQLINIHHSLLPLNGGLLPIFYSILNDEDVGTTIHLVNEKIDEGKVLFQKKLDISKIPSYQKIIKSLDTIIIDYIKKNFTNKLEQLEEIINNSYPKKYNSNPNITQCIKFYKKLYYR